MKKLELRKETIEVLKKDSMNNLIGGRNSIDDCDSWWGDCGSTGCETDDDSWKCGDSVGICETVIDVLCDDGDGDGGGHSDSNGDGGGDGGDGGC